MKKILSLLTISTALIFNINAQSTETTSTPEIKSVHFKYKLKLSVPITAENIDAYKAVDDAVLYDVCQANFNFEAATNVDVNNQILNNAREDEKVGNKKASKKFETSLLKALGVDSSDMDVYENELYNYSSLILGTDTLIGVKDKQQRSISFYLMTKTGKYYCTTEMGELMKLHSTQTGFLEQDASFQINDQSLKVYKVKMLNKYGVAMNLISSEMRENENLIFNFQYPNPENLFPLQINLFKNNNKYCYTFQYKKDSANSKILNKKVKKIESIHFTKMGLNELFLLTGLEY